MVLSCGSLSVGSSLYQHIALAVYVGLSPCAGIHQHSRVEEFTYTLGNYLYLVTENDPTAQSAKFNPFAGFSVADVWSKYRGWLLEQECEIRLMQLGCTNQHEETVYKCRDNHYLIKQ